MCQDGVIPLILWLMLMLLLHFRLVLGWLLGCETARKALTGLSQCRCQSESWRFVGCETARRDDIASSPVEKIKGEIVLRNREEGRDRIIAGWKGGGEIVLRNREESRDRKGFAVSRKEFKVKLNRLRQSAERRVSRGGQRSQGFRSFAERIQG